MLNKTMIALTAAIAFGSVSSAFAYEAPENKIGDRYPFLEQREAPWVRGAVAVRNVMPRQIAFANQYITEAPENRDSDRYPFLEQTIRPIAARSAGGYLASRMASRVANSYNAYSYEAPENKIGDRYPFLEATYPSRGASGISTAGRHGSKPRG